MLRPVRWKALLIDLRSLSLSPCTLAHVAATRMRRIPLSGCCLAHWRLPNLLRGPHFWDYPALHIDNQPMISHNCAYFPAEFLSIFPACSAFHPPSINLTLTWDTFEWANPFFCSARLRSYRASVFFLCIHFVFSLLARAGLITFRMSQARQTPWCS